MGSQPPRKRAIGAALATAPLALAAAWAAYSRWGIDHAVPLPPALSGDRYDIGSKAGRVSLYCDGPSDGVPLLLVHSVNAAANAFEVRPLYTHYRARRPVYALDLPGFGFSDRAARLYTPRIMTDAIHAAVADISARHPSRPIDVVALSLSCEYAARAALEQPDGYRSLAFISPTGFDRVLSGAGPDGSTRGKPWVRGAVSQPLWSQALFDLVTSRPSMRFFLEKTWGSKRIDEGLLAYDYLSAHQPRARHAVWSFLSGYLFSNDVSRLYDRLALPVWAAHGTRGDFVDYSHLDRVRGKPNWSVTVFETGAFPHFEQLGAVTQQLDAFHDACAGADAGRLRQAPPTSRATTFAV